MNPVAVLGALAAYFGLLCAIARITGRRSDDAAWFRGNRSSPWYVVAFGMVGTSLSGVTFLSVPGDVGTKAFSYLQILLGNLVGYGVVALVLVPLFYRLDLTSIYGYLGKRLGVWAYRTGAGFFLVSRVVGASFRLFLVALVFGLILERMGLEVPFALPVALSILLIFLYTRKGGIRTVVWTDTLQTTFLLLAAALTVLRILLELDLSLPRIGEVLSGSARADVWVTDWSDGHHWFKDILFGAFLAICMTGLDQDLMQKNLTCRSATESARNVYCFSVVYVVTSALFLVLGFLLYHYGETRGLLSLEEGRLSLLDASTGEWTDYGKRTDHLYPVLALDHLGGLVALTFVLGLVAAAYSSADSALAALTTSFCVDFLGFERGGRTEEERRRLRGRAQSGFALLLFLVILVFDRLGEGSVVGSLFKAAQYTYGPLLGMFAFGLLTTRRTRDSWTPLVCLVAPVLVWLLSRFLLLEGFEIGYLALPINGALTFAGLWLFSRGRRRCRESVGIAGGGS